jgi:putative transposase
MPKFLSKAKGDFSYRTNCQYPDKTNSLKNPTIRLEGDILYLPKMKGGVKLIVKRGLPEDARIGNVTISMEADGKLYASIEYSYTYRIDMTLRDAAEAGDKNVLSQLRFLGLDYSQGDFFVDSEGRKANYPHFYKKAEERLAKLQRELSHMEKGSKNYEEQKLRVAKLHAKIKNQRRDFLQKLSTDLVRHYDVIVVEDINLRGMAGGLKLGKNLHDNGFGMFRVMLAYKLEQKGSVLVKTDKWFASTKLCSSCGYKNTDIELDTKEWVCPVCGELHGRDENAAVNICSEGKRIFFEYMKTWIEEDKLAKEKADKRKAGRKKKNKKTA